MIVTSDAQHAVAVTTPTTDVNSESATVVRWYAEDRAQVEAGASLVEIETSKAILDVAAPNAGFVLQMCAEGEQVGIEQPLGYVFESVEALERFERDRRSSRSEPAAAHAGRITAPARKRADELGIDLDEVARHTDQLVTAKVVEAFAQEAGGATRVVLPDPLEARPGVQRLLIIGAGLGATQVLDILGHHDEQQAVALVDDDRALFGRQVAGVPVVGGMDRALELFADGAFDAAVISISTSVPVRTRLRECCQRAGIPLASAIDPTTRIASGVILGTGNVICANCHFGVEATVGDNNFISAYNSYDHHCELGSDISTGPGCMTSALVKLGDRCRLGTGVFIEPHLTIGPGAEIASGAVIVGSIPADHAVKTKVVTTTVVPIRRR
jgi:acetyltransferase-like isoleucine patch superfamily enzyme